MSLGHARVHGHSHARPVPIQLEAEDEHYRLVAAESHSISVLGEGRGMPELEEETALSSSPYKVEKEKNGKACDKKHACKEPLSSFLLSGIGFPLC